MSNMFSIYIEQLTNVQQDFLGIRVLGAGLHGASGTGGGGEEEREVSITNT